jgi:integrase
MAKILKRCDCPEIRWKSCPHAWVVRYRTTGGRSGRQREQSFGTDKREAEDFVLKVEHDKRAHIFIDPRAGEVLFRTEAEAWLGHHLGADSSIATYRSVLNAHVNPALGNRKINTIHREHIKELITNMRTQGLGASRIRGAYLVISAVLNEAIRDKKLAESPCTDIELPDLIFDRDFFLPAHEQLEALANGLPADWACTVWLMYGCGLRIGEALAVSTRCCLGDDTILRVWEQVDQHARLKPLKFRKKGDYRDIPLPRYVSDRMDKHIADHGTHDDGYLFPGRKYDFVIRRSYQEDFERAVRKAGLPARFIPHALRHCFASTALARGIPITEVSRWLGHRSIEVTHQIYGHLVISSWDRARTVLDDAYEESRDE